MRAIPGRSLGPLQLNMEFPLSKTTLTVARYLEQQLALCDKTQKDIAAACGYANPNIITMFKTGKTKVPLVGIEALAGALGVDPGFLLRLAMKEYMPEAWTALESILGGGRLVTKDEVALIQIMRFASAGRPIDPDDAVNRSELSALAETMADRDEEKADAAVRRLDALPANARHK